METTLPTLVELFVAAKQTEGKSPKTTQWYADFLNRFCKTMQDGHPLKLKDFSLDLARTFVAKLQERTVSWQGHPHHPEVSVGLSPYTVHAYVRVLKVFSGWLYEEGFTPLNTLAKLKRPRLPQPMIEILSGKEQKAGHDQPECSQLPSTPPVGCLHPDPASGGWATLGRSGYHRLCTCTGRSRRSLFPSRLAGGHCAYRQRGQCRYFYGLHLLIVISRSGVATGWTFRRERAKSLVGRTALEQSHRDHATPWSRGARS